MRKVLEKCPGCGGELAVTQLSCPECEMTVNGHFAMTRFAKLNPDNLRFAETFIRFRGNIKDMEREMGLSYPTVRGRLTDVIRALGFEAEDEPRQEDDRADERREVLAKLEKGEVDVADAIELIRKTKGAS